MQRAAEPRLRAFIAFSPGFADRAGTDDYAVAQRFGAITRPFLAITGSDDDAMLVGDASNAARRAVTAACRRAGRPAGARRGRPHDLRRRHGPAGAARRRGGLIRRGPHAVELEPRHQRVVAAITSDWWRWRLLGDDAARLRLLHPEGLTPADLWEQG